MRLPSPVPARGDDSSGQRARSSWRSSRRGTARDPALLLHLSGGAISWAVVDGVISPELVACGAVELGSRSLAEALTELVVANKLPRAAARLALPGRVVVVSPLAADASFTGYADIQLRDGRILRAELDPETLDEALDACAAAGIEVVGAEPEALALARALAVPSPGAAAGAPVAVVWHGPRSLVVAVARGEVVELVGAAELGPGIPPATAAALLLVDQHCNEVFVASATLDAAALATTLGRAAAVTATPGDPLARIRCVEGGPVSAASAAGAVGLAIEVRGLPRVDVPVHGASRPAAAPTRASAASPLVAAPAPVAPAPVAPAAAASPPDLLFAGGPAAEPLPGGPGAASQRLVATVVAATVVVATLVGAWAFSLRAEVRDREAVLATLQGQIAAIPSPTAPTRRLLALGADRRGRVEAIGAVLGDRVAWDRVLREVSAVLPVDVWLTGLSVAEPPAGKLHVHGYATTQRGVALTLARLGIVADLRDVRLERSDRVTVGAAPAVRFSIVASVRGEAR